MQTKRRPLAALALLILAAGCGQKQPAREQQTPEAGYVVVKAETVPLPVELAARTSAYEIADVRPQVSGVIQARRFQEGSLVRRGQTLYEIDPSLYRAAVAQAQAALANAAAAHADAAAKAARYKPLAAIEAIAKQDYTDAVAAEQQSAAQVKQAQANLQTAQINLRFTRVPAPISGRISRSLVTTGALVTNGQTAPLATITRLDPIFVDMQQSASDVLALRRALSSGGVLPASTPVQLLLGDGSVYGQQGRIEFSEAIVDQSTGSVTLRARFPNPQGILMPGMFVRARLSQAAAPNAILAPQQAVTRDPQGNATVMVVGAGDRAERRSVRTQRTIGADWLVTGGLSPGEKVITEGLEKIKAGQLVRPVPAGSPPQAADEEAGRRRGGAAR